MMCTHKKSDTSILINNRPRKLMIFSETHKKKMKKERRHTFMHNSNEQSTGRIAETTNKVKCIHKNSISKPKVYVCSLYIASPHHATYAMGKNLNGFVAIYTYIVLHCTHTNTSQDFRIALVSSASFFCCCCFVQESKSIYTKLYNK